MVRPPRYRWSLLAAGLSAFLWATLYLFILVLPPSENLPIVVVAPVFGGIVSLGVARFTTTPHLGSLARRFANPRVLFSAALLLVLQVVIVLGTRYVGAVNTSLLILTSDVLATPLLFYGLSREGGDRFRLVTFWSGVALIGFGALLTILGGGSPEPLSILTVGLGVPILFVNSFLVVATDQTARRVPLPEVLAIMMIVAFIGGAVGATLLYGLGATFGALDFRTLGLLVLLGVTNYSIAPLAFFWAAQRISLIVPSVLLAAIPVFTLLFVFGFGLQPVTVLALLGVPLAFFGAIAAALTPSRRREEGPPVSPLP